MLLTGAVLGRGNKRLLSLLNELKRNQTIFCNKHFIIHQNFSSMNYIRNAPDYFISAAAYYYAKTFHRGTNMAKYSSQISSSTSIGKEICSDEDIKERIKQTSEYFSQYIEEYYEEEEPEEEIKEEEPEEEIKEEEVVHEEPVEPIIKTDVSQITIDEVVLLLQEHRAQNIISIDVELKTSPWTSLVICSPYNDRHGQALMQTVRKHIKTLYRFEDDQMPRPSKITNGWFVFDMRNVLLHIMAKSAREKYQLEKLYSSTDEKEEEKDDDMLPPPSTQTSSLTGV